MKQPMKSRDVLSKNVPWVGWGGVGWGVSCRGGMIHTEHYHHLHTVPCGNYLQLLNYLRLLREHNFNYNHKLRLEYLLLSTKRET